MARRAKTLDDMKTTRVCLIRTTSHTGEKLVCSMNGRIVLTTEQADALQRMLYEPGNRYSYEQVPVSAWTRYDHVLT